MMNTDFKPRLKPGDIVFIMHNDSVVSKLIARFMSSKWSHSAMVFQSTEQKTYIIETSEMQVNINILERYIQKTDCNVEVHRMGSLTVNQLQSITDFSLNLNERLYGYLQLFSLGLRRILMRVGIKIPNFIKWGIICNQVPLLSYCSQKIFNVDPKGLDTEEFYDMVLTDPRFEIVYRK